MPQVRHLPPRESDRDDPPEPNPLAVFARTMSAEAVPNAKPGGSLAQTYPPGNVIREILDLPVLKGAIHSLIGSNCVFDHHFLHITFPPSYYGPKADAVTSQPTHQDSTIDPRRAFDIQIMYFPQEVTRDMGGTRYLPGSHLRIVSEASIGRYQNICGQEHVVCPAGSILIAHHGLWHGGGMNRSDRLRFMLKIRLGPTAPQHRLWDLSDLAGDHSEQRPIFWNNGKIPADPVQQILMKQEPWYEHDTGRLELLNRIRLWRYLLGDESFDADYWLTRVENDHG